MNEEQKAVPMVPKHQAQAEMMHMSWTVRWLVVAIVIGFVCMVIQAYIFVTSYNARTKDWLNTYKMLINQEAANEEESSGAIQQLPLP